MISRRFLIVALLMISFCASAVAQGSSQFAERYRSADTPDKRLMVCIDAINGNVIANGNNVEVITEIFGEHVFPMKLRPPEKGERETGIVFFEKEQIKRESLPNSAAKLSGWYLYFRYNQEMKITSYFITNTPFRLLE